MPASGQEQPGGGKLAEQGRGMGAAAGGATLLAFGESRISGVSLGSLWLSGDWRELGLSQHCWYPTHLIGFRCPCRRTLGGMGHRVRS